MEDPEFFVGSFNRPNLNYRVRPKRRSFDLLVGLLREHEGESAIVYLPLAEGDGIGGRAAPRAGFPRSGLPRRTRPRGAPVGAGPVRQQGGVDRGGHDRVRDGD